MCSPRKRRYFKEDHARNETNRRNKSEKTDKYYYYYCKEHRKYHIGDKTAYSPGKCRKRSYRTEIEAAKTLGGIKRLNLPEDHKKEKRVYECKRCNGWHITSTELRITNNSRKAQNNVQR